MSLTKKMSVMSSVLTFVLAGTCIATANGQESKKAFTVADEIGLRFFGGGEGNVGSKELAFSPDGKYIAIDTERGRLDIDRVEDSLRFYRTEGIKNFLAGSDQFPPPSPVWIVTAPPQKEGSVINDWRWLPDSSGVAYLESSQEGYKRLMMADIAKKTVEALTSETENIGSFDIRDRRHYVYTSADPADLMKKKEAEGHPTAIVGTGKNLWEMLFPTEILRNQLKWGATDSTLWAVINGKRFEVKNKEIETRGMVLSPDGRSIITRISLKPPEEWKTLYLPPYPSPAFDELRTGDKVSEYVLVDLQNGKAQPITNTPTSDTAGWADMMANPDWSGDGQAILLPGAFISSTKPSPPCVAVINLASKASECMWTMKPGRDANGAPIHNDYRWLQEVHFLNGDKQRVLVGYAYPGQGFKAGTSEYRRKPDGVWEQVGPEFAGLVGEVGPGDLRIRVKEGPNDPPLVIASAGDKSRVVWDPNPQLENIKLGQVRIYTWKAQDGRPWRGGLYLPPDYTPGQRYPLVLQTHGFDESAFVPAGLFPTGLAAEALANTGMVVLQVADEGDACPMETPDEGPCMVKGYEAAVQQLDAERIIDSNNIGMIGFSRTCYYTMEALTMSSFLHIKAALITDGLMLDYVDYGLQGGDSFDEKMIGAPAFGQGLHTWLQRSPSFNLDKVNAALMVMAEGAGSLLAMWHPYAALHYLKKPVDVLLLNSDEHTLTNPAVRMASQGGSVDWFRFWLKGEEDTDTAKADQYKRWRELKTLQVANEKKSMTRQAQSN
jgi:dipeptidyl aminopeptidase/acylaminoacyl peptidase